MIPATVLLTVMCLLGLNTEGKQLKCEMSIKSSCSPLHGGIKNTRTDKNYPEINSGIYESSVNMINAEDGSIVSCPSSDDKTIACAKYVFKGKDTKDCNSVITLKDCVFLPNEDQDMKCEKNTLFEIANIGINPVYTPGVFGDLSDRVDPHTSGMLCLCNSNECNGNKRLQAHFALVLVMMIMYGLNM